MFTLLEPSKFTKEHQLWELFIKFHTGQIKGDDRRRAKSLLFYIHYGNWDCSDACTEVQAILDRYARAH